jgi:acetyl-CoA carboxylase carboxyltransferase component
VTSRLRELSAQLRELERTLRLGGGQERIEKQHAQGKLTARERVHRLCDRGSHFVEIGLLVAYDQYEGQAPAAGVVTGVGIVHGREVVIVANDATVKAGSWWPETIRKILRAQEIAMRCRIPIIYLEDSAGVNLPYQGGVFPGQYGAARIFYYNSIMRRYLRIPQLAAVMGPCIAGGAYLPALSDVILMVKGTSFMGLGGPNLVKGATGQTVDGETLGGAVTHTEISGVAHYALDDDASCLDKLRELVERLPRTPCTTFSPPIIACRTTCTPSSARSWTAGSSTSSRPGWEGR